MKKKNIILFVFPVPSIGFGTALFCFYLVFSISGMDVYDPERAKKHFKGTATVCLGENKIWIFDNIVDEYDEFSHDSCESDFSWFALFSEPSVKLSQYVIMSR